MHCQYLNYFWRECCRGMLRPGLKLQNSNTVWPRNLRSFFYFVKKSPICLVYIITSHFEFSHFAVRVFLPLTYRKVRGQTVSTTVINGKSFITRLKIFRLRKRELKSAKYIILSKISAMTQHCWIGCWKIQKHHYCNFY